jgi:Domain of unknown function DUF29
MLALLTIILSLASSKASAFTPRHCRFAQRPASYIDHLSGLRTASNSVTEVSVGDHDDIATSESATNVLSSQRCPHCGHVEGSAARTGLYRIGDKPAGPNELGVHDASSKFLDLSANNDLRASVPQCVYEEDFVAWLDDTAAKLEEGNFAEIDVVSLVEEIQGLSNSERQQLRSRLRVLLTHLLKRMCVDSKNDYRNWESTIREQRRKLEDLLEDSPSLKNYWEKVFPGVWIKSLSDAKAVYPDDDFPSKWEKSRKEDIDAMLNKNFWESES